MRAAGDRRGRVVRGDRPLAADGRGWYAVFGGQGDGIRGQRDGHVPDARTRGRAGFRGRGHGAVPDVPSGDARGTQAALTTDAGRVWRPSGRGGRVRGDRGVRRVVRNRAERRRRRPRVSQRVCRGSTHTRPRPAVAAVPCRHRDRRVSVPQRRVRGDHHQALHRLQTVLASRPDTRHRSDSTYANDQHCAPVGVILRPRVLVHTYRLRVLCLCIFMCLDEYFNLPAQVSGIVCFFFLRFIVSNINTT